VDLCLRKNNLIERTFIMKIHEIILMASKKPKSKLLFVAPKITPLDITWLKGDYVTVTLRVTVPDNYVQVTIIAMPQDSNNNIIRQGSLSFKIPKDSLYIELLDPRIIVQHTKPISNQMKFNKAIDVLNNNYKLAIKKWIDKNDKIGEKVKNYLQSRKVDVNLIEKNHINNFV